MSARRMGTSIVRPNQAREILIARTAGEDWVVPREPLRFLVLAKTGSGAILSAFDAKGRLVGERFAPKSAALEGLLEWLHLQGAATVPCEIPDDVESALGFLGQADLEERRLP